MILKLLTDLADKLDSLGYAEEADKIDTLLKSAGFLDLFRSDPVECKCQCDNCNTAKMKEKGGQGTIAIRRAHCGGNECGYKKK